MQRARSGCHEPIPNGSFPLAAGQTDPAELYAYLECNKSSDQKGSGLIAHSSKNKRDRWLLAGIILIGLALRGVMFAVSVAHPERTLQPDSQSYLAPALKLLSNGAYPADSAYRTPLYPFLIALVYALGGQNSLLVILVQVLLGTLVVFLTYALGVRILPKPTALIGTLLISIDLGSITNVFYILTETLFTFLLMAAILAWVEAIQQDKTTWLVISSTLMGLSVLCRPIAVYFPILLAAGLLFIKRRTWLRLLRQLVIYIGVFLVVLLPWVVRNEVLIGIPTVTTISNYNLLFYNAASLDANLRHISEIDDRAILQTRLVQFLVERSWADTIANRDRAEESLALQIIARHPSCYAFLHLKSDLNSLLPNVTELTEILGLTVGGKGTLSVLNQNGIRRSNSQLFWRQYLADRGILTVDSAAGVDLSCGSDRRRRADPEKSLVPAGGVDFPDCLFPLHAWGCLGCRAFGCRWTLIYLCWPEWAFTEFYQWARSRGSKKKSPSS